MSWKITINLDGLDDQARAIAAKKVTDAFADLVAATPVDEGTLKGSWEMDTSGPNPTISNPMPYTNRLMNGGHSKQAPPGTADAIWDKHFGPFR